MDILQQEHVDVFPKGGLEALHLPGLQGHDQPVGELLGREIGHAQALFAQAGQIPAHGLEEMGLAQARGRTDEKLLGRKAHIADALGGHIGQLVRRADHEFVVAEAEAFGAGIRRLGGERQGQGPGRRTRPDELAGRRRSGTFGNHHRGTRAHDHGGGFGHLADQPFPHPGSHEGIRSDQFQAAVAGPGGKRLDPEVKESGTERFFEQGFGLRARSFPWGHTTEAGGEGKGRFWLGRTNRAVTFSTAQQTVLLNEFLKPRISGPSGPLRQAAPDKASAAWANVMHSCGWIFNMVLFVFSILLNFYLFFSCSNSLFSIDQF